MPSSLEWRQYYEANARSFREIPWQKGPELTLEEKAAIAQSLQAFQVGESSEGKHLFRYAKKYAELTGDLEYVVAIRLFIAEEQRHAGDLKRFLTLNNIPIVSTTLTDRIFRRLRNLFGGLEVSIAVLITAEIIATVYYAVLREATQSSILKSLCDQILCDELRHVQFQAEQLARLRADRQWLGRISTRALQRLLFLGTILVVWLSHHEAMSRGGSSISDWWRLCWRRFNEAFVDPAENKAGLPGLESVAASPGNSRT